MDLAALSGLLSIVGNAGAAALLVVTWGLMVIALFRKWVVPGWIYEESEARAARAADAAAASAAAAKEMSDVLVNALMRRTPDDPRAPTTQRRGDSGKAGYTRGPRR